ncbi:Fanconi anemia group M protein isoform X2 [Syngnathus acus]|uniref:Fanconi anemia group M protein isoform X2 n=1 Tax=Syngnathus acus TaxID=161584 RepID=UPI001886128C|nr:Fanconi anemia group M protein isoform X2 [Syngnathus acus]
MSSSSNQRTLFQTWGASVTPTNLVRPANERKKVAGSRKASQRNLAPNPLWAELGPRDAQKERSQTAEIPKASLDDEDDDDDLMIIAVTEAEENLQKKNVSSLQDQMHLPSTPLFGNVTYPDFPGFDSSSATVWIYPTNFPIRDYQLNISKAALFQNTLVCLPTGLGKTFIAAVVMYNFYRWYPAGKIIFMAPTKPLVAQQIEACYKVMGIPQGHMAELTGTTAAQQRQEMWRSKRVFFLTPQVMMNDLSRDTCPARQVKCVVIDEAHKAQGNHAYCQVIRQLSSQTLQFRVLALSATPGGNKESVQSVISNLLISHIELRLEESPDILAHSHQRSVEKMVVPLGEVLAAQQARYLQVLEKFMSRLALNRVMAHKDLQSLCKYQLILARDQFRKNPPTHIKGAQQGMLEGDFALCISLYHGYELLMQMGLRSLFFYVQGIMDGSRELSRVRNELQRTPVFMDLYHEMEAKFGKPAGSDEPFIYGHPKLQKLEDVVLQHFRLLVQHASDNNGSGAQEASTRVMIFSSFRDSVQEIASMLNRHGPLIRVMTFMGQASAGKGVKGFTQKEQLEVVSRFRQGGFNTLVSTCVGEEGLDIGEVDLIVCFDAQKNPIRLVQRMGRTGRKRQGRIVVILAEGREERTYNQSQSNKRSLLKSIVGNKSAFHMYPNSPRMLPDCITPTLHKMHITSGQFEHRDSNKRSSTVCRSFAQDRASLIHPQNLLRQEGAASGAFLSNTEYSLWVSTMKLAENEPQPTLRQSSNFMSLPNYGPPPDAARDAPVRELSLSEWRHWQHRAFPTHAVDHSLRCQHFTKVMQLVDSMREENEGDCAYEKELLSYLNKADTDGRRKKIQKNTCSKTKRKSVAALERQERNKEEKNAQTLVEKLKPRVDPSVAPQLINEEPVLIVEDDKKKDPPKAEEVLINQDDEDAELQAMFYLPKWDSWPSASVIPGRDQNLNAIRDNVAELLSRSPPPSADFDTLTVDSIRPPHPDPPQPFHVSFTLDVDEDDEVMASHSDNAGSDINVPPGDEEEFRKQLKPVSSPTWDEVFEDGGANEAKKDEQSAGEETNEQAAWEDHLDDSMDLFGDDEAFLLMTIPDIHPPKNHDTSRTLPSVEDIATSAVVPLETCDTGIKHTVVSKGVELSDSLDFPVNFDLGYSLEDSEEEEDSMPLNTSFPRPPASLQEASPCVNIHSSTPYSFHRLAAPSSHTKFPTPQMLSERKTTHLASPLTSKAVGPVVSSGSAGPRAVRLFRRTLRRKRPEDGPTSAVEPKDDSDAHRAECILDSDDDVVVHKRRQGNKVNPLSSPEAASNIVADADSPLVRKKRVTALNISEADDDDDFQSERVPACKRAIRPIQQINTKRNKCQKGREFLDEEAVLSEDEEGAAVSSDEDDGREQNRSLDGFVVDNTHLSQGLNDSEMRGIYLKSVQSPIVGGRYKMSYKNLHNPDIFSQVPEQDETYKEDSFVVGSQEEQEEEEESSEEAVELMPEDSYVDGRRQYATRRRVFLHKARANTGASTSVAGCRAEPRSKRGRVLRLVDSSEEEEEGVDGSEPPKPIKHLPQQKSSSLTSTISKVSGGQREERQQERGRQRIENQHALSDQLDFETSKSLDASKQPQEPPSTIPDPVGAGPSITETPICILVDSRCLSGSVELVTSLRQHHSATVHVCSLDGNYFVVSARMAVERHAQSDLASLQNRKRLAERLSSVQEHFERICLIVEKDRIKPGETTRSFQRTRCFDSTLSALVRTGVRLLWSDGPQQSAALLVELARLEQRKGHAVALPSSELSGRQDLQFYLSLPSVNYVHALNMSRRFGSVGQLVNSSVESLEHEGGMSRARAEEIYRFLHYSCDSFLVDQAGKSRETVTHTIRI